jgi:hypothetical protein
VAAVPAPIQEPQIASPVVPLPPHPSRAIQVLTSLQIVSSVLAASLVGLALISYGATVYVDRQLNQATRRLHQLQRSEQQLTTANEVLKSHMAQQADGLAAGLTPPNPDQVIFLRPAQQRPRTNAAGESRLSLPRVIRPMGY